MESEHSNGEYLQRYQQYRYLLLFDYPKIPTDLPNRLQNLGEVTAYGNPDDKAPKAWVEFRTDIGGDKHLMTALCREMLVPIGIQRLARGETGYVRARQLSLF